MVHAVHADCQLGVAHDAEQPSEEFLFGGRLGYVLVDDLRQTFGLKPDVEEGSLRLGIGGGGGKQVVPSFVFHGSSKTTGCLLSGKCAHAPTSWAVPPQSSLCRRDRPWRPCW